MDEKSINTLELPAILESLSGYAGFSGSTDMAHDLRPTIDLIEAQARLQGTSEARNLLEVKPDLTIGGARDIRSTVAAADRGAVLEPTQLLDVKSTLLAARRFKSIFEEDHDLYPVLQAISGRIELHIDILDDISRTLDERGEVLDSASPELNKIRRELQVSRDRLLSKLQKIISDPKTTPMLQEPIITQRDGRYVIPLRAEFKGKFKSVVQDQSASGATLFVEPIQTVELNNGVRELELSERDEILRILKTLSELVGDAADSLSITVECLAEIDLALAKARYANELLAVQPVLYSPETRSPEEQPASKLNLIQARHPLLDPKDVVPIDLVLDNDIRVLVITGPNTGGKTVSLKTAGLLSLMASCGLHIPAEGGSELSLFDAVYADIGDEQSIEQSLSTFSSHISNIIRILEHATQQSLVLLDELGAGTDPQEGAALARAILDELLGRDVMTLIATHISSLKSYAHLTDNVRNASVEFDLDSLRPTYRLLIGLPGRSNALAIAGRLGMDPGILDDARNLVSEDDLVTDALLDDIYQQRDQARQTTQDLEETTEKVRLRAEELDVRLSDIDQERRELLLKARQEADEELAELRREIRKLRRRLTLAGQPLEAIESIAEEAKSVEDTFASKPIPEVDVREPRELSVALGDKVYLKSIESYGVVTSLSEAHAEVQVGRLRVRARLDELTAKAETKEPAIKKTKRAASTVTSLREPPPLELDLRGMPVDEALEVLDRRLDASYLAGMPYIRIVHGKGTGKLRTSIRAALKDNSYVASFAPGERGEGGDGVTVVRLRSN